MQKFSKVFTLMVAMLALAFCAVSCKVSYESLAPVPVTAITLNKTATEIQFGSTETLSVTSVLPDNATDKTYTWKASDASKATVDQDGKVTAVATVNATTGEVTIVGAGTATITATVTDSDTYTYASKTASYTVSVTVTVQSETLLTTITATGQEQASYSTENVATVSFSYTTNGSSAYHESWGWCGYGWTATVTPADGYTITKCVFYDDANRTATDSEAPFVVEATRADKTPQVNGTPISARQSKGITKIEVYGYVNP